MIAYTKSKGGRGNIFGNAKKKFSSMSKSTKFRNSMRISVKSVFVNNDNEQQIRPSSAREGRENMTEEEDKVIFPFLLSLFLFLTTAP